MNHQKTGRPQVRAGLGCTGSPELNVSLDGAYLVHAWRTLSGDLIVLESSYSLANGHEVKTRTALWLAELMGWNMPAIQQGE